MKEIVIVSGKGGTGKTTIVASFATLAERKVLADCDVDAADLHLLLNPEIRHREAFCGGKEATIRVEDCTACGACLARCRYDAIRMNGCNAGDVTFTVDRFSCEGCGVCVQVCPVDAIDFRQKTSGEWFVSETRHGPMVHARLGIAEENSGKLVSLVRKHASQMAVERGFDLVIIDGPPGIGCPVIASIGGTSLVLAVTEPTLSGLHDLRRVVDLASHFCIPVAVCINKCDINPEMAEHIHKYCQEAELTVAGQLPYDPVVTSAQLAMKSVVEYTDSTVAAETRRMWEKVLSLLEKHEDGRKEDV